MLSSITPLGERGRQHRWGATVAWYLAGSIAGGAVAGATAGTLGRAALAVTGRSGRLVAVLAVAGIVAALLMDLGGRRLPGIRRQVNEDWLSLYRRWVYAAGFGFQLGLGVATIVTTAATYATWWLAALTGGPWLGATVGVAFGAARALPVLAVRGATTPGHLRRIHRRMQDLYPRALRLTRVTLGVALVAGAATMVAAS